MTDDIPPRMAKFLAKPPRRISEASIKRRRGSNSRAYPKSWHAELMSEQKSKCFFCGCRMLYDPPPERLGQMFTIDHFDPLSKGGKNKRKNVVGSCHDCNNKKGSMPPAEFIAILNEGGNHHRTPDARPGDAPQPTVRGRHHRPAEGYAGHAAA